MPDHRMSAAEHEAHWRAHRDSVTIVKRLVSPMPDTPSSDVLVAEWRDASNHNALNRSMYKIGDDMADTIERLSAELERKTEALEKIALIGANARELTDEEAWAMMDREARAALTHAPRQG